MEGVAAVRPGHVRALSTTLSTMIIKSSTPPTRSTYDHAPLAAAAVAEPGSWFADDDESYPNTAPAQIRRGAMSAYRPAGAFTARRIDGRVHVAFLGVPKRPWDPGGEEPFDKLERTLNPARCPEGTPETLLAQLIELRRATERAEQATAPDVDEPKSEKKKGKKKKAKKHRS